jgi:hypothetical protein
VGKNHAERISNLANLQGFRHDVRESVGEGIRV